ncbi:fungal-specific transcription factor domain-containing protein [Lipomyces japonicus]|uniref:fungal-specific transcription factor domain-containing protein n=1 Tax=Lipomyces japonicus TaxID=56871 RepID=UPI0034CF3FFB
MTAEIKRPFDINSQIIAPGPSTQRRRISRACDQCNQCRTRCDGKLPCQRCSDLVLTCDYARQRKKRGKGSETYSINARKDSAGSNASSYPSSTTTITDATTTTGTVNAAPSATAPSSVASNSAVSPSIPDDGLHSDSTPPQASYTPIPGVVFSNSSTQPGTALALLPNASIAGQYNNYYTSPGSISSLESFKDGKFSLDNNCNTNNNANNNAHTNSQSFIAVTATPATTTTTTSTSTTTATVTATAKNASTLTVSSADSSSQSISSPAIAPPHVSEFLRHFSKATGDVASSSYLESLEELAVPDLAQVFPSNSTAGFAKSSKPPSTTSVVVQTPGTSTPRWFNIRSPFPTSLSALFQTPAPGSPHRIDSSDNNIQTCHFPVLRPVMPMLDFLPPSVAADLLEVYYSNTIYGIGHFTRPSSVLATKNPPRQCSPSLLFSFLYVAAHVSDHPHLTSTPTSRSDIIWRLHELIIAYLQPLVHADKNGTIDDVMTYINLGIISSASEFKGASVRWWHAAWGLARVLKLNVEVSADPKAHKFKLSEEQCEERRRVWWLLFLVDRHLGLCYNRPITILDHESTQLYRPCRDELWKNDVELIPAEVDPARTKGLLWKVTANDVWGYFLPLMTLLGGIVNLRHLEMTDTIGLPKEAFDPLREKLRSRLSEFLKSVDNDVSGSPSSDMQPNSQEPQRLTQRTIWKEYCRCLIHVFHILVAGYWDPIEILSLPQAMVLDTDFVSVIQHSLDFAKCLKKIIEVDMDLRTIPFFFGIHMLQGSFTLLYIVDVLNDKEVRESCETIVRAHEVCIVTLNTEYQRNFRQIMRGALQMIDALEERKRLAHMPHYGASPPNEVHFSEIEDSKRRRRGLLSLYRWSRGGSGLAV